MELSLVGEETNVEVLAGVVPEEGEGNVEREGFESRHFVIWQ